MSEKLRILLVDDDETDRRAVRRALRGLDVHIEEETSAARVVDRLLSERYDCAILDHGLPGEDGLSLLRRIRAAGLYTPILAVAGYDEGVAAELVAAGASDYLAKTDVSSGQLVRRLRFAIRVGQAEERARVAQQQLAQEQRFLGAVIAQMPAAVIIADA